MRCARGQAAVLIVGALCAMLVGALVLGGVARGIGARSDAQRAADLAALAGARALYEAYPRLFEPVGGGRRGASLATRDYLELGRAAATRVARANGASVVAVSFPDGRSMAPVRIRVSVGVRVEVRRNDRHTTTTLPSTIAEAELVPGGGESGLALAAGGGYSGPLAMRQGKPMRPDVASAFDRLIAAARGDEVTVLITSGYRSDAEQAVLFARRPDPRWVAPPGRSLHRYGTELDLGPPAAYGWLAANAPRFGFAKRYEWEDWHFGYTRNAASRPSPAAGSSDPGGARPDGELHRVLPEFVPPRFAAAIGRAAQRWNVSGILLAAQLHVESGFNPFAVSTAGARGIAQFMPATARAYGLSDPSDPAAAIDAQAHLMRDLLREFASVPLALAAYNAGPARVRGCHCIPPFPETRGYVARIIGLMTGAGEEGVGGLSVRLVR